MVAAGFCLVAIQAPAAENLRLRDGVSFVSDSNVGFPLVADKIEDVKLSGDRPTLVFFGASGDLNTARQAKRLIDVYKKYKAGTLKFVVIDVDRPANAESKAMIKSYYQGYIPQQVLFDGAGKQRWTATGEVEVATVNARIDKLL